MLSSTYRAGGSRTNGRTEHPTWEAFEEALGALEGGESLVYSSGMAAVAAVLSLVPLGGGVVAPTAAYNGVLSTLAHREEEGTLTVNRVDPTDAEGVIRALEGADLLWLESPSNPLLEVADIRALARGGAQPGVRSMNPASSCVVTP